MLKIIFFIATHLQQKLQMHTEDDLPSKLALMYIIKNRHIITQNVVLLVEWSHKVCACTKSLVRYLNVGNIYFLI